MHRTIIALLTGSLSSLSFAATPMPVPLPPVQTPPVEANSCYIACYGHQKENALSAVGTDIYLMGRVLVKGKYAVNKCVPDGYEGKDISQAPYFKELCAKQIPACGNNCWAGGDTNNASIRSYRSLNAPMSTPATLTGDMFPLGKKKMTVSIPSISVEYTGRPTIQAGGIIFNNTWDISSTVVNHIVATSDINRLTIGDLSIGPIHLDGDVSNINLKALSMLILMMNQSDKRYSQSPEQMQMLNRLLPQVVTPSTTIKKNVLIKTPEGDMTLNSDIHWNASQPQPSNVPEMFHTADISIAFKIAVPLVTKILTSIQTSMQSAGVTLSVPTNTPGAAPISPFEAMINAGVQQGYIIKDANNYQVNITQKNGVFKVNNNVINIPYNPGPSLPPASPASLSTPTPSTMTPTPMSNDIPTVQP